MVDVAGRHDLSDEARAVLEPLLPVKARGRRARFLRRQIDGIRFRVRVGCPWRDVLADRYGPWGSVYRRFGTGSATGPGSGSWIGCARSRTRPV
ncbi:transposase [Oerskovia flava]|uniref:transposase n=1 Tax=Oerskovia flava TaxID=2986422 RepID=UPI003CCD84ED